MRTDRTPRDECIRVCTNVNDYFGIIKKGEYKSIVVSKSAIIWR